MSSFFRAIQAIHVLLNKYDIRTQRILSTYDIMTDHEPNNNGTLIVDINLYKWLMWWHKLQYLILLSVLKWGHVDVNHLVTTSNSFVKDDYCYTLLLHFSSSANNRTLNCLHNGCYLFILIRLWLRME